METLRPLRVYVLTHLPADVDSHNIVCSWCAQTHVSLRSCDVANGYIQGREIDRLMLYRIPAGGIPEEGIPGGAILASLVQIYGTKDAGRGLWIRLKENVSSFWFFESNLACEMTSLKSSH